MSTLLKFTAVVATNIMDTYTYIRKAVPLVTAWINAQRIKWKYNNKKKLNIHI